MGSIHLDLMEMPPPQITIIGAGLSGLVLGRCLLYRGFPCVIFEKDTARSGLARYGYGITLQSSAYSPLLKYFGLDDKAFQRRLAVDAAVGGSGKLNGNTPESKEFRANRQKLEQVLREGLDIRWEHQLTDIKSEGSSHTLQFRNGQQTQTSLIIDAEGPHSHIRRSISPTTDFEILPYAVYNGKRRISRKDFEDHYVSHMNDANVISHQEGQTLLQISVNDRRDDEVSISYTYSRPERQNDPVFKPDRPNSGAKDIPEELFVEISELSNLRGPFKDVFDAEKMPQDRMLNWLMRSVSVSPEDLMAAANQDIVLIGDAVHATPILGGNGANAAIRDGIELAEFIAEHGTKALAKFYEGRHEMWRKEVVESESRLAGMHERAKANL